MSVTVVAGPHRAVAGLVQVPPLGPANLCLGQRIAVVDAEQLYFWFWKVAVDVALPGLASEGRAIRVRHVGVDEYAVRVLYELVPPLRRSPVHPPPMYGWLLSARDDLGTVYDDGGGAVGRSLDGRRTEGVRSLLPLPPDGAAWLELAFHAVDAPTGTLPRHRLRIEIPRW